MKKILIFCIMLILASCEHKPINGIIVKKNAIIKRDVKFLIFLVEMKGKTYECLVDSATYCKYDIGDSVFEKGRYYVYLHK